MRWTIVAFLFVFSFAGSVFPQHAHGADRPLYAMWQVDVPKEVLERARAVRKIATLEREEALTHVEDLKDLLWDDEEAVRRAAASTLGELRIDDEEVVEDLMRMLPENSYGIVSSAALALGRIGAVDAVYPLAKYLHDRDDNLRTVAAEALSMIDDEEVDDPLLLATEDPHWAVRRYGVIGMGNRRSPETVPKLAELLSDEDNRVREAAVAALGDIGAAGAAEELLQVIEKDKHSLRLAASKALEKVPVEPLEPFHNAMESEEAQVRRAAAKALAKAADPRSVPVLLKALNDKVNQVQWFASEGLRLIGSPSVEPLMGLISNPDRHTRSNALRILRAIKDQQSRPAVLAAAEVEKEAPAGMVRKEALWGLKNTDSPDLPDAALKGLQDRSSENRSRAIIDLAGSGGPEALEAIIPLLKDPVSNVQYNAAKALGKIGDPRAVTPLLEALDDPGFRHRSTAVYSLGRLGDPGTVSRILPFLKDPDRKLRSESARALGRLGDPAAVEPLLEVLNDEDQFTRIAAANALGMLKARQAVEPLAGMLREDTVLVRRAVVNALAEIGGEALPVLAEAMADPKSRIREAAEEALRSQGAAAIPALVESTSHEDIRARRRAIRSLVAVGGPEAFDACVDALEDPEYEVRKDAVEAIGELGDEESVEVLSGVLFGRDEKVIRAAAAVALGRIGGVEAVEALIKALKYEESWVHTTVLKVLEDLSGEAYGDDQEEWRTWWKAQ